MSFGTFWGTNPLDPVSYQKVLPKYLPDNAPATSVIRITDANPVTVPAPTVQNEALTVIDVAGELETFSINPLATPPADLTILGVIPYTTPLGELDYIVWGFEPAGGVGQQRGVMYIYSPNDAVPANGVWTKRFITDIGVPQRIITVCYYNYATTISEGAIPPNGEYAIYGDFASISDADGANVVVATQLASWDSGADVATALPLAAGVGFTAPAPQGMIAIPTALSATSKLIFYSSFQIVYNATTYQNICIYSIAAGGTIISIGSNANDGQSPAGAGTAIFTCNFDYDNRLLVGGNFAAFQIGGAVPAGFSTQGIALLTFSAVQPYFDTLVATFVFQTLTSVLTIRNVYNGQAGVSNDIVVCGDFIVDLGGTGTATDIFVGRRLYAPAQYFAIPLAQSTTVAYEPYAALVINQGAYIAGNDLAVKNAFTYGIDNAFISGWDSVGGTFDSMFFNWYGKGINAVPPRPLSFIVFQKAAGAGTVAYSGSYQAAQQTTITFGGGATARYIKASGAVGNATQAIIAQQYASFSLIGDLANNIWDVIGEYGTIAFSP